MKDYDCGSIPRLQSHTFCIFMQLFIEDLSFEKSSRNLFFLLLLIISYEIICLAGFITENEFSD